MYSGTGIGAYQSVGFAGIADGVFGAGTGIETVKTWGFRGGLHPQLEPVLGERRSTVAMLS